MSRLWISPCLGTWWQSWKLGVLHHRSVYNFFLRNQIVDMPVRLITEKIVAYVFGLPQERVHNRATYTGKVFTVRHQACTVDNVGCHQGSRPAQHAQTWRCDGVSAPDHQGQRRPCGASGFLVRSEIPGCCGRAFVPIPDKALGPQQPLQAQRLLSRCCRSSGVGPVLGPG